MDKKIIKFNNIIIEEYKLYQNENTILINDIDLKKIVVSNKLPFSKPHFKYFIGYKDAEKIRPLWILHPEIIEYGRKCYRNRSIYFAIKEENFLINIWKFWKKLAI